MKENRVLEISFCYFSRLQIVKYSKFFCSITSQQKKEISRSFENVILVIAQNIPPVLFRRFGAMNLSSL
jgi:hypothetical protein